MLNKKTTIICTAVICIMLCNACGRKADTEEAAIKEKTAWPAADSANQQAAKDVADRSNQFSFDIFKAIQKSKPHENIFISPFSISAALTAVSNGAEGETKNEMKRALSLEGVDSQKVNLGYYSLFNRFDRTETTLAILVANSVWLNSGLPYPIRLKETIKNTLANYYKAQIDLLDFGNSSSPKVINDWVDDKTQHRISNIIKELNPNALMRLLSAIYFKGRWVKEFDPSDTKPGPFFLAGDKVKKTEIMKQTDFFGYFRAKTFHALSLDYLGKMSMQIFLPIERNGIFSFLDSMNAGRWRRWNSIFEMKEVNVSLPKFKLEFEQELKNSLKNIGMNIPFDERNADFHALAEYADPNKVFIGSVKHKAMVDVNEKGTVAAAVTQVEMFEGTGFSQPTEFIADHPFFFIIKDDSTNCILFSGIVMDPGGTVADKNMYAFKESLPAEDGGGGISEWLEEMEGSVSLVAGEIDGGMIAVGKASISGAGGAVSAGDIQAVIDQGATWVNSCYQRELKKSPDLKGKLSVQIKVNTKGYVSGVTTTSNSVGDAVARCVENKIRGWSFPKSKEGMIIDETFAFKK